MKIPIVIALIAGSSAIAGAASADSACFHLACATILVDGGCEPDPGVDTPCGDDAGTCRTNPYPCTNFGVKACLGPDPPVIVSCADQGGCGIAAHPARAARRAALPFLMLATGAVALFVDRRRRAGKR
jgi:hypothetical protein